MNRTVLLLFFDRQKCVVLCNYRSEASRMCVLCQASFRHRAFAKFDILWLSACLVFSCNLTLIHLS